MANLVINKTGNIVDVDFGNYAISDSVEGRKATYLISDISIVWLEKDDSFVNVKMKDAITVNHWKLSFNSDSGVL